MIYIDLPEFGDTGTVTIGPLKLTPSTTTNNAQMVLVAISGGEVDLVDAEPLTIYRTSANVFYQDDADDYDDGVDLFTTFFNNINISQMWFYLSPPDLFPVKSYTTLKFTMTFDYQKPNAAPELLEYGVQFENGASQTTLAGTSVLTGATDILDASQTWYTGTETVVVGSFVDFLKFQFSAQDPFRVRDFRITLTATY